MKLKSNTVERPLPWLSRGDMDGFFGLFIDNLLQLMLITVLCQYACGFSADFITGRILPGAALSILAGNLFYTFQARRLAYRTGRRDVTAIPFGINTISLLAFVFLVMAPVYNETGDSDLAWKVGLAACFLSGLIETAGAFVGSWLKRNTPRPALLSGLAGVALSFMTLSFTFQIFAQPAIALVPALLVLFVYGARVRLPLRIPGGLFAVGLGAIGAWVLRKAGLVELTTLAEPTTLGIHFPIPVIGEVCSAFFSSNGWRYVAVVIPISLFNVISSIQNLESAEAAGDKFKTRSSLLMNGFSSLLAGVLGSPFPTTIYIGHPGWKAMGAKTGYSLLNGVVIAVLCFIGAITVLLRFIPLEVTLGILIWIGLVIVAQAFSECEKKHAIAVVLGLLPALAAWALHIIETTLRAAGTNLFDVADTFGGELYIHGIISLYQGFLLTGILLSAILAFTIDRKFVKASLWSFTAAALSFIGLIHAYQISPDGIQSQFGWMAAPWYAATYATLGVMLLALQKTKSS